MHRLLRGSDECMSLNGVCHLCGGIFPLEELSFPPEPVLIHIRHGGEAHRVWSDSLSFRHKYKLDSTCLYCSSCVEEIKEALRGR